MHDLDLMHSLQTAHRLNENLPNLTLLDVSLLLFVLHDLLENVAIVGQLHDYAERLRLLIDERFLVLDDVWVID